MARVLRDLLRSNREFAIGVALLRLRRRDGGAVGVLALSAERHLRRAARHPALAGPIRSAPRRAARTCSGS